MESESKVLTEREIKKQIRKIFTEFLKDKNFSKYDKEIFNRFKILINAAYYTYKDDFFNYLNANLKELNDVTSNLEEKSKDVIRKILKDAEFYKHHNLVKVYEQIFKEEDKLNLFFEKTRSFQQFKLPATFYESSVFEHHHGLIYVPKGEKVKLKGRDFIDCGGFIGDSALIFETYYYPRMIFTFEPDLENYNFIFETIRLNNLKKVVPVQLGVGSKQCTLKFIQLGSSSRLSEKGDCEIEVTTIDDFVKERDLNVGLIKMDIEGGELEALNGARTTIETFKPVLLIAIYHNAKQFINVIKYVQNLNLGYKIIIRQLGEQIPIVETHMIAW